jgi:3-hydroxyacyl-CoA dehydrogenase
MFYADALGAGAVLSTLEDLQGRFGDDFAPAPLLRRLASEGGRFQDLQEAR